MIDYFEALKEMHAGKVVKYIGTVNGNVWEKRGSSFCMHRGSVFIYENGTKWDGVGKMVYDPDFRYELTGESVDTKEWVVKMNEQPKLTVRLTSFPESNGKRNWTAMFVRTDKTWKGLVGSCGGIVIAHGELWNRVAYEAERAKFLIGERDTEPFILDYGKDIETPDLWGGENGRKKYGIS